MAGTVLGKRARALESTSDLPSNKRITTRSGASTIPAVARNYSNHDNVENIDPKIVEHSTSISQSKVCAKNISIFKQFSRADSTASPAKHQRNSVDASESEENYNPIAYLPTPKTPRHRDALSKKVPITPRHRVLVAGKPMTPRTPQTSQTSPSIKSSPNIYNTARQLFVKSANPGRLIGRDLERQTLKTFIHSAINSGIGGSLYVSGPPGTGKSALVNEVCGELKAPETLRAAYLNCMSIKSAKDVYAKLMLDFGMQELEVAGDGSADLKAMFLPKKNTSADMYLVTLDEIDHLLTLDLEILTTLFEWSLHRSSRLILVGIANALDLTDRFLPRLKARNLRPQLLPFLPYTVSQIASVISTKLNTLLETCPETQTKQSQTPIVHPAAIQFCAKKVASQTGDLRKAFDIMRGAIDLIEAETRTKYGSEAATSYTPSKKPLGENPNLSSPSNSATRSPSSASISTCANLQDLTAETAPRAMIAHVSRVTSAASAASSTSNRLTALNLQQKAALISLISLEKKLSKFRRSQSSSSTINGNNAAFQSFPSTPSSRSSAHSSPFSTPSSSSKKSNPAAPTVRQIYDTYATLCVREKALHPLSGTEFADVLASLEGLGLVGNVDAGKCKGTGMGGGFGRKMAAAGGAREQRRMGSWVAEREVESMLDADEGGVGGAILRGLLCDE